MFDETKAQTKICSRCGEEKPATKKYFSPIKTGRFGIMGECKICRALKAKEYRRNNPEKVRLSEQKRDKEKRGAVMQRPAYPPETGTAPD